MASQGVELGQTPPDDAKRDAVHVAIVPAVWAGKYPTLSGNPVKFDSHGNAVEDSDEDDYEGVVDPFLDAYTPINPGTKIWVLMRPGTVKNLRHTWEHVSVEDE